MTGSGEEERFFFLNVIVLFLKEKLASSIQLAKSSLSLSFLKINFYQKTAMPTYLSIVCGCFHTLPQLSSCDRDQ